MTLYSQTLRTLASRFPAVVPHLSPRARWAAATPAEYKTQDYYVANMERLIRSVYNDQLGGEFIDIMASLIQGQLTQAFQQAWMDEEGDGMMPDYLTAELENMILSEYDHVDSFFREIVDARLDETPLEPLLSRAAVWANRWTDAYNTAVRLITSENGGNLIWRYGDAEHCETCQSLNGIVARASEWEALGVHPQQPPNELIECGGWRCQCSLEPTDKRRSPKAFDTIMNIVSR